MCRRKKNGITLAAVGLAGLLAGCSHILLKPDRPREAAGTGEGSEDEEFASPPPEFSQRAGRKELGEPLPLDSLLEASPIEVAVAAQPADAGGTSKKTGRSGDEMGDAGHYRIQLLTVADFETAQEKKQHYSQLLGGYVEVVFDAPFYKLRYGSYPGKTEAQNALLEIQDLGLQGFVVKD